MSDYRGITAYVCVGRYAGFGVRWDKGPRVVLGWVSLAVVAFDLEMLVKVAADALDGKENSDAR